MARIKEGVREDRFNWRPGEVFLRSQGGKLKTGSAGRLKNDPGPEPPLSVATLAEIADIESLAADGTLDREAYGEDGAA